MIRLKNKSSSDQKNQMTKKKTLKDSIREKINKFDFDFSKLSINQPSFFFSNTGKTSYQSNQNKSPSPTLNQPKIKGSNWKTRESSDKKKTIEKKN